MLFVFGVSLLSGGCLWVLCLLYSEGDFYLIVIIGYLSALNLDFYCCFVLTICLWGSIMMRLLVIYVLLVTVTAGGLVYDLLCFVVLFVGCL